MADSDYEYSNRDGSHFLVTHQNGVPRYQKVIRPPEPQPEMLGTGLARKAAVALKNSNADLDKNIQAQGG